MVDDRYGSHSGQSCTLMYHQWRRLQCKKAAPRAYPGREQLSHRSPHNAFRGQLNAAMIYRIAMAQPSSVSPFHFLGLHLLSYQTFLSRVSQQVMAIDCSDVPANVTYSCHNPWGSDCISRDGFQLDTLWRYTRNIQAACPSDERLHIPDGGVASVRNASLTHAACELIADKGWTYYPTSDIWNRLTMWVCQFALSPSSCSPVSHSMTQNGRKALEKRIPDSYTNAEVLTA